MKPLESPEAVSDTLEARIAQITVANGYETDIGLNVLVGKRKLAADDEIPCANIIDFAQNPKDLTKGAATDAYVEQRFLVVGTAACEDKDRPNATGHKILRDIKKAIWKDGTTWGGLVGQIKFTGSDMGMRPEGGDFMQGAVSLTVSYVERLGGAA